MPLNLITVQSGDYISTEELLTVEGLLERLENAQYPVVTVTTTAKWVLTVSSAIEILSFDKCPNLEVLAGLPEGLKDLYISDCPMFFGKDYNNPRCKDNPRRGYCTLKLPVSLERLSLIGTGIKYPPVFPEKLTGELNLQGNEWLSRVYETPPGVDWLNVSFCPRLVGLPEKQGGLQTVVLNDSPSLGGWDDYAESFISIPEWLSSVLVN